MDIHPSAVIEEGAVIGEGCQIGPFCYVGAEVVLGKNNILHSHVVLDGRCEIGDENAFFSFACIGKNTQDQKYTGGSPGVKIGSRNAFREYATMHCATYDNDNTVIGDDCLIQAYCHVAHDCQLGNHVILSSGAKLSGHVEMGDHSIISGMTGVIQFVKVGEFAFVGGYAKLTSDIPPYCLADGIPAKVVTINKVGLERKGYSKSEIKQIYRAYRLMFKSDLVLPEIKNGLAQMDNAFASRLLEFIENSDKGILLK
jgi:UDP-N-acetylglucosamine acyltransferase